MTPLTSSLLTATGLLLVIYPLVRFTQTTEKSASAESSHQMPNAATSSPSEKGEDITVYATLRYTGTPSSITLRRAGHLLFEQTDLPAQSVETSFSLPAHINSLELLIEVRWPATTSPTEQQAVTLTLEPSQRASRSQTVWAQGKHLHDLLLYLW